MTDISATAPTVLSRFDLWRPSVPTLRIGASLAGISGLLGDAFRMSYVPPCTSQGRWPQTVPDDDLEGRDPSW